MGHDRTEFSLTMLGNPIKHRKRPKLTPGHKGIHWVSPLQPLVPLGDSRTPHSEPVPWHSNRLLVFQKCASSLEFRSSFRSSTRDQLSLGCKWKNKKRRRKMANELNCCSCFRFHLGPKIGGSYSSFKESFFFSLFLFFLFYFTYSLPLFFNPVSYTRYEMVFRVGTGRIDLG